MKLWLSMETAFDHAGSAARNYKVVDPRGVTNECSQIESTKERVLVVEGGWEGRDGTSRLH